MTAPKIIPNLNQILFNRVSSFDFMKPKIKKIIEIKNGRMLISFRLPRKDQKAIIKKTTKKTRPKLLFDPILILELDNIIFFQTYYKVFFITSPTKIFPLVNISQRMPLFFNIILTKLFCFKASCKNLQGAHRS